MMDQRLQRNSDTSGRTLTLRDIVAPIFRHRRLVVLSFSGILLGAAIGGLLLPKQYKAQMKILVKFERADPVVTSDRNPLLSVRPDVSEEALNSEVELLKSRDLLEKVVLACGLHHATKQSLWARLFPKVEATGSDQRLSDDQRVPQAARALEKTLQVEPLRKTSLIKVTYESSDPQLAARVLTTLANLYLEKHVAVHRPPGAFDFFQRETERYQNELSTAEARLAEFDREGDVVAAQMQKEITLQKLTEFDATLHATQSAVAETDKRIRELEAQLSTVQPRLTTQMRTADNPVLSNLKSTLLTLELKRTELLARFAPDYRPVQEVEQQIAQTRAAITEAQHEPVRDQTTDRDPTHEWLRTELARARTELAALQARAIATAQIVRRYSNKVREIDQKGTVQQSLMRSVKTAEENYLLYLRKQEEARISDALDRQRIVNVAIAEAATVPSLPSSPGWWVSLLAGTLLASFVSVGLAYASDYFDASFRTPGELQAYLGLPVLAATPKNGR
ncbi:MAG: GumC family protein [Acidobacteria bacterium]|nr:GumC family protein [Acidobacteriota bacterium]